ncbi:MAG: CARDB domain-containing protein [Spirulina sp.]
MSSDIGMLDLSSNLINLSALAADKLYSSLSLGVIEEAFQGITQSLQRYAQDSLAPIQLEEIYGIQESTEVSILLDYWSSGVLVNKPSIQILDDQILNGAKGAYAADSNHVYIAKSLASRDNLTGLKQVLIEEYGHALDVYFNGVQDTLGDEGEWFSLAISGTSLSDQDKLRLHDEDDRAFLWLDNQLIAVEQSTTTLDFNGDSRPDILWRNAATGLNDVWFMGGTHNTQLLSSTGVSTFDKNWDIKGISDFNGDDRPDILWRHKTTGQNILWFMGGTNNTQNLSNTNLISVDNGWDIKGISDFNGDGRPDILWRHGTAGQNVIWFMGGTNNTQISGSASLTTVDNGWDIKGISDFNSDGRPDILWRHGIAGQNVLWFMGGTNNTQISGSASLATVANGWDIKGIADFNSDNRPDILWRHGIAGQNVLWFMGGTNNAQISGSASLATVDSRWTPNLVSWQPPTNPDLVVTNQYVPTSANAGDSITINAYTKNQGDAAAGYSYMRYWLSDDATLNTSSDRYLGNNYVGSLTTGSSEYDSLTFTYDASWGTGSKYILFEADGYGYVTEANESNNVTYQAITINGKPDLVITSQYAPTSANVGDSITVSAYTKNQGTGTASYSYMRYLLSNDTIASSDDYFLGSDYVNALSVGSSEYDDLTFTYDASWGTGNKYILFQADGYDYVAESSESNNVAYRAITINGKPDLVITSQYTPTSATIGDSIAVSSYTKNQGSATAGYSYLRYWLSDDITLNSSSDRYLGNNYVGSLAIGISEYDTLIFTYDTSWGTGTKYILFEADGYGYVAENNESNNVAYRAITINGKPDLVITSQYAPTSVNVGDSITVSAYTKNQGTGTASYSYMRYLLSNDTIASSDDYFLGSDYVNALSAGNSEYDDLTFTYDASWGTGNKYILFQSDGYDYVAESSESNNVAYRAITINGKSDLIITGQYAPTSANAGDSITVSAYTKNQGTNTAGYSYVRYWLSDDITLNTSNDRYLGNNSVGSLATGSLEYDSLAFIYDVSWGTGVKYILFEADGYGYVAESNEINNSTYQAIFINAKSVKPLTYQDFNSSTVFSLNSKSDASHTIYLDFDGHVTTGTSWNLADRSSIITPAFDTDGNSTSFSVTERETIWKIWQRVAEDFIPFNVNVTTVAPSLSDLIKSDSSDTRWGIRVAIGGSWSDWYSESAGGVAYRNSFNWNTDTPTFIFSKNLYGGDKSIAEAVSHEVGHTLGLSHDGDPTNEYYAGHGTGVTGWASIMGVGYYQELTQWSKGEYYGATRQEDDLYIIITQNGFGYRKDDYSDLRTTASRLFFSGSNVQTYGIIEQNTDVDWFKFYSSTGKIALNVTPFSRGANLDVLVKLYNSLGQLIQTVNPIDNISAALNVALAAGDYYISVEGTGKAASGSDYGYTQYGSLGQYSITGTIS